MHTSPGGGRKIIALGPSACKSARNASVRNDAKTNAAIWKGVQGNAPANRK